MNATEAMWQGEPDRLEKARSQARIARNRKDYVSAHSIMLSAYITILAGKAGKSSHFTLFAVWHALMLLKKWRQLSHTQLDVLIQFLLKFRSRLPGVKVGQPFQKSCWYSPLDRRLLRLTAKALVYVKVRKVRPHQKALALMTSAEVRYAIDFVADPLKNDVMLDIEQALDLEYAIRAENDQPQGLRQFVRILRKAGELYMKPEMRSSNPTSMVQAQIWLQRALDLARGEAHTPDQVEKILPLIRF